MSIVKYKNRSKFIPNKNENDSILFHKFRIESYKETSDGYKVSFIIHLTDIGEKESWRSNNAKNRGIPIKTWFKDVEYDGRGNINMKMNKEVIPRMNHIRNGNVDNLDIEINDGEFIIESVNQSQRTINDKEREVVEFVATLTGTPPFDIELGETTIEFLGVE